MNFAAPIIRCGRMKPLRWKCRRNAMRRADGDIKRDLRNGIIRRSTQSFSSTARVAFAIADIRALCRRRWRTKEWDIGQSIRSCWSAFDRTMSARSISKPEGQWGCWFRSKDNEEAASRQLFMMSFEGMGKSTRMREAPLDNSGASAHGSSEFPASYSLTRCSPAELVSASPAGIDYAAACVQFGPSLTMKKAVKVSGMRCRKL